jgi:predicted  nucleic acid-binding Zn-ribbon protein
LQRWWIKERWERRKEVTKLEYKFNEIKKLEIDIYDLNKELNKVHEERLEIDNKEKGIKEKMQMKKETLDREYINLKDLFILERNI